MPNVRNGKGKHRRTGAERQRRRRARQRLGRRVYAIELDAAAVEDALIWTGDLHLSDADRPGAVARALEEFLRRVCAVTRDADDR